MAQQDLSAALNKAVTDALAATATELRGKIPDIVAAHWPKPAPTPDPEPEPEPQTPPAPAPDTNPTGGTGGPRTDPSDKEPFQSFNNGKDTSQYRLYASHLTGSGPHGIIIALHGDHSGTNEPYWFRSPDGTNTRAMRDLARKYNMLFVIPRTPDRDGSQTWWNGTASEKWAVDLLTHLGTRYNLDLNKVWWVGYSGGSDAISETITQTYSNRWTGGGAVLMCGGGGHATLVTPFSASIKQRFPMHWVVGADDDGRGGTFNAKGAAERGAKRFRDFGLTTSLTIVKDKDHGNIGPDGVKKLTEALAVAYGA